MTITAPVHARAALLPAGVTTIPLAYVGAAASAGTNMLETNEEKMSITPKWRRNDELPFLPKAIVTATQQPVHHCRSRGVILLIATAVRCPPQPSQNERCRQPARESHTRGERGESNSISGIPPQARAMKVNEQSLPIQFNEFTEEYQKVV